jgi:spermidine synthase
MVGKLLAFNTLGAISGSLLAGFVILDTLGLWAGIRLLAMLYVLSAWLWLDYQARTYRKFILAPAILILLMVSLLDTSRLPLLNVDPVVEQESLLEVWEGSSATVAVIRQREELKLKVNNYYTLGGSGSFQWEQLQGYLPLLLHQNPQSVYILGMGTGITAGGSLLYPISSLKVTELIPEVVKASEKYFGDYNNQLFFDPRVEIIVEDGRNYLRGSGDQFDVIISDLFVPWKAGVGSLYTLEHYQTVKNRLNDKGLFMQWLPTYQLTLHEFVITAKTMQEVFPQVTVWRGDFGVLKPIIGLLGQLSVQPLSTQAWLFNQPALVDDSIPLLSLYVGDLANFNDSSSQVQINRDDFPLIEMMAPISQLETKKGRQVWLAGQPLLDLMLLLSASDKGRYLSNLSKTQKLLPQAGYWLHDAQFLKYQGRLSEMDEQLQKYRDLVIE